MYRTRISVAGPGNPVVEIDAATISQLRSLIDLAVFEMVRRGCQVTAIEVDMKNHDPAEADDRAAEEHSFCQETM
tara:strand:- start:4934 stop:5158 length:225 start_codon:yes stop_codon:yes gene_type:complete